MSQSIPLSRLARVISRSSGRPLARLGGIVGLAVISTPFVLGGDTFAYTRTRAREDRTASAGGRAPAVHRFVSMDGRSVLTIKSQSSLSSTISSPAGRTPRARASDNEETYDVTIRLVGPHGGLGYGMEPNQTCTFAIDVKHADGTAVNINQLSITWGFGPVVSYTPGPAGTVSVTWDTQSFDITVWAGDDFGSGQAATYVDVLSVPGNGQSCMS